MEDERNDGRDASSDAAEARELVATEGGRALEGVRVALAHDYLTTRGGAERVALALTRAFPGAPLHVSLFEPSLTFPEFSTVDVRPLPLNRIAPLRHSYRAALPFLAPAFSALRVDADVVVCSSSGWSHGLRASGRKIAYCHAPARWLYQPDRYLRGRGTAVSAALAALTPALRQWDARAMQSADLVLANSTATRTMIHDIYDIDAEVVHPPIAISVDAPRRPVPRIEPGFVLCVSRLLPYKNVESVVRAFAKLPSERLVVVGEGPEYARLAAETPSNVRLLGRVEDDELRWLYASSGGLVCASYEDFGLTPIEAAVFGKPTAALRFGGFVDTVEEGRTGILFDDLVPTTIAAAVRELIGRDWDESLLLSRAAAYSEPAFAAAIVGAVLSVLDD